MKKIATLCSRYATPQPLCYQFSLSFIFCTVYLLDCTNLKDEQKRNKKEGLDSHLQNLHTFE